MLTPREQYELDNLKHKLTVRQLSKEEVRRWKELDRKRKAKE